MKNLILLLTIALGVCLGTTTAFAADVDATIPVPSAPPTYFSGGTNKVAALATNSFFTIDVSEATDLLMFINFGYQATPGAGDVNRLDLRVFRGIDGSTFESNAWQTISFAAGSTTVAGSTCTNIAVAGIRSLRGQFVNVSTNANATNLLFKAIGKVPAFRSR